MLEEKRLYQIEYRKKNKDKLRIKNRLYYQANKAKFQQSTRNYYQKHGDKVRAAAVRTGRILRVKQRFAVLAHYSSGTMACVKCGFSDVRALCLDHIKGGGTGQRRRFRGNGGNMWLWLARHNFPPGYQILCANCNTIKAREEDEYGSGGTINSDWRSQLAELKEKGWVGRHRTWEDRMTEDYGS